MKYISQILLLTIITVSIACSGAKEVATNNSTSTNSLYPTWYGSYEFSSDSTTFSARATAVADNSEKSIIRAEKEARALLESYIAKELEDIRSELERDGSKLVKKPEFILMLRNAHSKIEEEATVLNSKAMNKEGIFRGFAKVEITKKQLKQFIENGLSSNAAYLREFTNALSFKELVSI
jgi:hypothetical protein